MLLSILKMTFIYTIDTNRGLAATLEQKVATPKQPVTMSKFIKTSINFGFFLDIFWNVYQILV